MTALTPRHAENLAAYGAEMAVELARALPALDAIAREFARGWPAASSYTQPHAGNGAISNPTEDAALEGMPDSKAREDPRKLARRLPIDARATTISVGVLEWLDTGSSWLTLMRDLLVEVTPVTKEQAQAMTGRPNDVEICEACGLPAPTVRRFDGRPYHAESCWWQVAVERRA